jgi:phosphoribosylamine--glycine ligase
LENDLVELLSASIDGTLSQVEIQWNPCSSVCVVMASAGYPGSYTKGNSIEGLDAANSLPNTKVFHAGTSAANGRVVTNGGRVLGVTSWARDLQGAQNAAYAAVDCIRFEGAQYRRDIANKGL